MLYHFLSFLIGCCIGFVICFIADFFTFIKDVQDNEND